jgi:hypothetical protein
MLGVSMHRNGGAKEGRSRAGQKVDPRQKEKHEDRVRKSKTTGETQEFFKGVGYIKDGLAGPSLAPPVVVVSAPRKSRTPARYYHPTRTPQRQHAPS